MCVCVCVFVDLVFKSCAGSSTMKGNDMGWECSTCEEDENSIQGFGVSVRKEETVKKTR